MNKVKSFLQENFSHDIMVYGGVLAAFWAAYSAMVLMAAALADLGFSPTQTGTIMSARSIVGMVACALIGNLADRVGSPRKIVMFCSVISAVMYALGPVFMSVGSGIWTLGVLLILIAALFASPMHGLCDSWVMRAAEVKGTFNYAKTRYFGSFSYAIANIVYAIINRYTGSHNFTFYAFGLLCLPLMALAVYTKRDEKETRVVRKEKSSFGLRAVVKNYYLLMFLICYCLASMPMNGLTTFLSYKLIEVVGSTAPIGVLSALRSFAEIPSLLLCVWLIKKIGLRKSMGLVMILFTVVQVMLLTARGMGLIYAALFLIGFTNGGYMVCQIRYVHAVTEPEARATAVSLCVSMAMISGILANAIGGVLTEAFGTGAYFIFCGSCVLLSLLIFIINVPIGKRLGFPVPEFKSQI